MKHLAAFIYSVIVAAFLMYLYFAFGHYLPGAILLGALPVVAVGAGYAQGRMMGHQYFVSIGCGALLALLLMWAPLVVLTYGFALMGVPVLMALAACAAWGARLARPKEVQA